jgi:hypothetical protein
MSVRTERLLHDERVDFGRVAWWALFLMLVCAFSIAVYTAVYT